MASTAERAAASDRADSSGALPATSAPSSARACQTTGSADRPSASVAARRSVAAPRGSRGQLGHALEQQALRHVPRRPGALGLLDAGRGEHGRLLRLVVEQGDLGLGPAQPHALTPPALVVGGDQLLGLGAPRCASAGSCMPDRVADQPEPASNSRLGLPSASASPRWSSARACSWRPSPRCTLAAVAAASAANSRVSARRLACLPGLHQRHQDAQCAAVAAAGGQRHPEQPGGCRDLGPPALALGE